MSSFLATVLDKNPVRPRKLSGFFALALERQNGHLLKEAGTKYRKNGHSVLPRVICHPGPLTLPRPADILPVFTA